MTERLYKVTAEDGTAMHGGRGKWKLNRWRTVTGDLVACRHGLHLCREGDLICWLGPVIWEAEYEGEVLTQPDKIVVRKARVIRRLDTWNERTARLFAADCAEHVLPIFEKAYPNDTRVRASLAVVRRFANREATAQELAAARTAAAAARDAAWFAAAAARAAAWAAARTAAWAASGAAARAAAWFAEVKWQSDRLLEYLAGSE